MSKFRFTFKTIEEREAREAVEDCFEYEAVRVEVETEGHVVDFPLKDEEEYKDFLESGRKYNKIYQVNHGWEDKVKYDYLDY